MAFQNTLFPELKLVHGMSKTKSDSTQIFGNGLREYRLTRGDVNPITWSFPGRAITKTDAQALVDFYNSVNGMADSFKFEDPDDRNWVMFQLEHYNSTYWTVKSNSGSYIYNLNGNVVVYFNDAYYTTISSVTIIDDIPVVNVAGSISSDKVELNGFFYYTARFNSTLNYDLAALNNANGTSAVVLNDVSLKEVPEHA